MTLAGMKKGTSGEINLNPELKNLSYTQDEMLQRKKGMTEIGKATAKNNFISTINDHQVSDIKLTVLFRMQL